LKRIRLISGNQELAASLTVQYGVEKYINKRLQVEKHQQIASNVREESLTKVECSGDWSVKDWISANISVLVRGYAILCAQSYALVPLTARQNVVAVTRDNREQMVTASECLVAQAKNKTDHYTLLCLELFVIALLLARKHFFLESSYFYKSSRWRTVSLPLRTSTLEVSS
jgi:hypothetical protein